MVNSEYGYDPWERSVAFQIQDDRYREGIEWALSVSSVA